jgi:hypothetical protein
MLNATVPGFLTPSNAKSAGPQGRYLPGRVHLTPTRELAYSRQALARLGQAAQRTLALRHVNILLFGLLDLSCEVLQTLRRNH